MGKLPSIRTPWAQHARRVRYQLIPVVVFVGAAALTVYLWGRHAGMPNVVGEVEAVRMDMCAPADGFLIRVGRGEWQVADPVGKGTVVAQLDSRPSAAALATLRKELGRLQKELAATEARVRQELASATLSQVSQEARILAEARRLAVDVEQLRLDVLDRKAQIETDTMAWQRQNERYKAAETAFNRGVETAANLAAIKLQRDVVDQRIKSAKKALAEADRQLAAVTRRRDDALKQLKRLSATTDPADVQTFLAPVEAAVSVQEARMREVQIQIDSLTVRSPVRGSIFAVYRRPGQFVRTGEPILCIAGDHSRHVISYVRDHHAVRPSVGMKVKVHFRSLPRRTVDGEVEQIGPQFAEVPAHQLRDPTVPEWGMRVRISVPEAASLCPGELVDVRFDAAR